jgi:hypothetical protein
VLLSGVQCGLRLNRVAGIDLLVLRGRLPSLLNADAAPLEVRRSLLNTVAISVS